MAEADSKGQMGPKWEAQASHNRGGGKRTPRAGQALSARPPPWATAGFFSSSALLDPAAHMRLVCLGVSRARTYATAGPAAIRPDRVRRSVSCVRGIMGRIIPVRFQTGWNGSNASLHFD
ncbi:hypothetical protein ZWY2020_011709 [Hordeum vulgare]|nr:hypothetical protein ZWY2020_011709 [Hordeum vulgare]